MIGKACSRCGRVHRYEYQCNKGKVYKGGEERRLRSRHKWAVKSHEVREGANHLCEVCRDNNIFTYDDLEVHHIEKLRERPELWLENENLICLCKNHHKQADEGKIDKDYLKRLAYIREHK